jgi:hypothetical protein
MGARKVLNELKKKFPNAKHHRRTIVKPRKWPSFYEAAHFLFKNRKWKIVHGTIIGSGEYAKMRIPHAWCTYGGMVYDEYFKLFLRKEDYEKALGAISYSEEMTVKSFKKILRLERNYGPWLR